MLIVNYAKRSFLCDGTILVSRGVGERKEKALSIFTSTDMKTKMD